MCTLFSLRDRTLLRRVGKILLFARMVCYLPVLVAQDTPLLSGGLGFFTNTNGGSTSYQTIAVPVLEAPIGQHLLVESRANVLETFSPQGNGQGYNHSGFLGLSYLQADYIATPHLTVVGGYFLIPFGTYNERLSPIWISNLQDAPLIYAIGTSGGGSGTGGMLRGNAYSTDTVSISYAAYFSAGSTNKEFQSSRSTGGEVYAYFPKARLEIGTSYGRTLEGTQSNAFGAHLWWEPAAIPLKIRSEYAHGAHSQGYWIETDYRLSQIHGADSLIGRLEPIFRMQQTFRNNPDASDFLPSADTQRADFGLDYHLPHEVRINTSYSRQFSSTGNFNVWETGVVYRFLFPAWKGKSR
jgi:hypothetical protein